MSTRLAQTVYQDGFVSEVSKSMVWDQQCFYARVVDDALEPSDMAYSYIRGFYGERVAFAAVPEMVAKMRRRRSKRLGRQVRLDMVAEAEAGA